jgi:hypothetical protein
MITKKIVVTLLSMKGTYQRVGAWFPILGNSQCKLPYKELITSQNKLDVLIVLSPQFVA